MNTLANYISETQAAIFQNPPRNNPAYANNPVLMWRYYMRCFGAGLAGFDKKEVQKVVSGLYSSWFIRLEFHSKMPKIDAKEFFGWIYSAMEENTI